MHNTTEYLDNIPLLTNSFHYHILIMEVTTMIMNLNEVKNHIFSLYGINVFLQHPIYKKLALTKVGRGCNGFLYIKEGECKFSFKEGSFTATKGNIVYLPFNSRHTFTIKSENPAFYRIDFNLKIDDELVYFSTHPIKIADTITPDCYDAIIDLYSKIHLQQDNVFKTEKMCAIFKNLQDTNMSEDYKKLSPSINYIAEHYTETLDCHLLAELCHMSLSYFYELFKKEFNVTPLEYRNKIILQNAKAMLRGGDMAINEIASILGFSDTAYFSRFFKKHTKKAPSNYIKTKLR